MMENGQSAESIIANLMGFDDKSSRYQAVSGQQKVFSDRYLQKHGCIGKYKRKNSQNHLLRSKKKANLRTSGSDNDILSSDVMQGTKSPIVGNSVNNGQHLKSHTKIRPNLTNVEYASGPSFLIDSRTVFGWEVKKQLLESLKMTKVSQPEFRSLIGIKEGQKNEYVIKLPVFKPLNFSSKSNTTKSVRMTRTDAKTSFGKLVNNSKANSGIKRAESFHGDTITEKKCNCSAKGECSSHVSDLSSEQDSLVVSHGYSLVYSDFLQHDEEHPDGKGEIYQRTPISVLEPPFREDNSSSSEYGGSTEADLHGLSMQLQLLKSESEENDINPEMVTSSDDEKSCTDEIIQLMIPFGTKESRDYSYLVDVLDESGFQDGNREINLERWHSSEFMASPLVFEMLEKKYGKQELWHKAERRLLFDRINAGMTYIVRPHVDIRASSKPLRRKMANILRRDVIEEELLTVLVSQEKGVNDGLSEKAVGRGPWFDPVEELDSLVREIEIFLFDQLAAELVSA